MVQAVLEAQMTEALHAENGERRVDEAYPYPILDPRYERLREPG